MCMPLFICYNIRLKYNSFRAYRVTLHNDQREIYIVTLTFSEAVGELCCGTIELKRGKAYHNGHFC